MKKKNRFWVKKMFKLQAIDGQNPEVTWCHMSQLLDDANANNMQTVQNDMSRGEASGYSRKAI